MRTIRNNSITFILYMFWLIQVLGRRLWVENEFFDANLTKQIDPRHPGVAAGVPSPDPRVPGTHTRMADASWCIHVRARSGRIPRACAPIIHAVVYPSYFRVFETEPGRDRDIYLGPLR